MSNDFVSKEVCVEKHKSIDEKLDLAEKRLNDHSGRIKSVEEAVIVLTNMSKNQARKDIFDKILIVSVFLIYLVLVAMILGPEITGKILGHAL